MEVLPTIHFFDSQRMGQFFQYLVVVFVFVAPILTVWLAMTGAGHFIQVIKRVFAPNSDKRQAKEQERYDIKYNDKY